MLADQVTAVARTGEAECLARNTCGGEVLTREGGACVVFARARQHQVGFVNGERATRVAQCVALAVQRRAADGICAGVGGVLRSAAVVDAAEGRGAVALDEARNHAQAIATRESLGVVSFADVIEAHVERGRFAVNGVNATAQCRCVVGTLFVAVVAVVAHGNAQPSAARE